ncbi:putative Transmembrane protein 115 [Hypsibius exemplaris]|uniref:Transmembrane protein 115 n=1 Tax=Hypsibius exemplaris TaxID=2072580 RepID=A0A1W0X9E7_HYPEX|nr:putative Transmembrane protein 115 [Hypsibius exemplaris]
MSTAARRAVSYFGSQVGVAVKNSSVVVKCVCIAVTLCYFLTFSESAVNALTVTPGTLLPPRFHIWTAFTSVFVELHWWLVVIDLIVVGLCAKLIEPMWGALEMLIFFEVINCLVVLSSVVIYFVAYCVTSDERLLFDTHIHGLTGYVAAVCVAVKQIMPDHVLFKLPIAGTIKFRNRNLPLLLLLGLVIVCAAKLTEWVYFWMFLCGTYAGFIYLRYLQKHSNGARGDESEAFDFATFFPNVLQPPVGRVVNVFHAILVKLRILKKHQRKYNFAESLPTGITVTLPGSSHLDAERRK